MADFGCPSMAKRLALLLVLLSVDPLIAAADLQWSGWLDTTDCIRMCSEQYGAKIVRRRCFNCSNEESWCDAVSPTYCYGSPMKTDICYVAAQCKGRGPYIGEWTEWQSTKECPPMTDRCRGIKVTVERKCVLAEAVGDRSSRFRCPGVQTSRRSELCPCGLSMTFNWWQWTSWSNWSVCEDPCGGGGDRMRRRGCEARKDKYCDGDRIQISPCPVDPDACRNATGHSVVRRAVDDLDLGVPSFLLPTVFVLCVLLYSICFVSFKTLKCVKKMALKKDKDKKKKKGEEGDDKDKDKDTDKDKDKDKEKEKEKPEK